MRSVSRELLQPVMLPRDKSYEWRHGQQNGGSLEVDAYMIMFQGLSATRQLANEQAQGVPVHCGIHSKGAPVCLYDPQHPLSLSVVSLVILDLFLGVQKLNRAFPSMNP